MPERPSETPALKAWNNMKRKMMFETGLSEETTVSILKSLSYGRRAIQAVIEEARTAVVQAQLIAPVSFLGTARWKTDQASYALR